MRYKSFLSREGRQDEWKQEQTQGKRETGDEQLTHNNNTQHSDKQQT